MMLPSGMIMNWSGSIATIPAGFVICDGNNGTPDLRNRFVVGAGDTYAVNATGGAINHDHNFTSDGHFHGVGPGSNIGAGANFDDFTDTNVDSGVTNEASSLPPYFALAFIMKT